MKKLLLKLTVLLSILVIINVSFVLMMEKILVYKGNNFLSAIVMKHVLLKNAVSPKIVFIGGSNLAFSQDTCRIEETAKSPTVNMGLHGGLGLNYMMEEIKDDIRTGDTVVIVPEYDNFFDVYDGDITLPMLILNYYTRGIRYLNDTKQYANFPQYLISFIQTKGVQLKDLAIATISGNTYSIAENSVYRKDGFDECGDLISHLDKPSTYPDKPTDIFKERNNSGFDEKAFTGIGNFANALHSKGIRVVLIYPTIPKDQYATYQTFFEELHTRIKEIKNITVPNDPVYYTMENEAFYDSNYHLNQDGRQKRTKLVIDDMKKLGIIK